MPVAAKRKKTEDMPDSPPKRVTRARAKTTETAEPKALPKKTGTATKPSTSSKKAANQSTNTTKRKTRADDAAEQIEEGPEITDEKPNEGAKLRGRTTKTDAAAFEQQDASKEEKPKARTRKPAVTRAANVVKVEALKTRRGRSNKGEDGTGAVDGQGEKEIEESVATKKTSHVKATTKRSQETATKPAPRAAAAKKRVKFEEDPLTDKENVPLPTKSKGKGSEETTGLKAKPVRKPATSKPAPAMSTVATRRAVKTKGNTGNITQDEKPMPLSPKKVTQVAKPASVGSEDELSGGKTPIRAFSRSPIKQPQNVKKRVDDSPVKFNFGNPSATTSPIKIFSASVLTSPARRPPPSPFKDAMRESPKRGGIVAPQSSIKQSSNTSPFKNSLQISPKRGVLFSGNKPNLAQPSIVQSSLLKSPARRPIGSPDKSIFALSPVKSVKKPNTSALKIHREEEEQDTSSTKSASSPFRAGHSASVKIKPYTFTSPELNKEQATKGSARKAIKGFDDPSSRSATPRNFQSLSSTFDDAGTFNLDFETLAKSSPIINDAVNVSSDHRQGDVDEVEVEQRTTTPDGQPRYAVVSATEEEVGSYRESAQDDESEDELSSPSKATFDPRLSMFGISTKDFAANPFMKRVSISPMKAQPGILTPLATKLSSWGASSPQKLSRNEEKVADPLMDEILATGSLQDDVQALIAEASPTKPSSFDEQMDLQEDIDENCELIAESNMKDHMEMLKASMESTSSAEYGDENEIPLDSGLQNVQPMVPNVEELTCTPARVFECREIHTVSKVPLRPAGDEHSPPKIIKKRSKSISTFVPASRTPEKTHKKRNSIAACSEQAISLPKMASSALEQEERTSTPAKESSEVEEYDLLAHVPSPIGSSRKPDPGILKGIIAFVDVHTSEGADASGIFYDLLTQMGARCVKQWNWNPRASMAIGADSDDQLAGSTKPGISHVIYKDGGKRTLEKVRAAQGAVECVGVGWVLDCERQMTHLSESDYAIDTCLIPRGGSRRRKSMEPKMLANLAGTLVPAAASNTTSSGISPLRALAPASAPQQPQMSPTKEFLTFDTPKSRRETFILPKPTLSVATQQEQEQEMAEGAGGDTAPCTPISPKYNTERGGDPGEFDSPLSPTTPYYLSKGAALVQRTCPPKPSTAVSGAQPFLVDGSNNPVDSNDGHDGPSSSKGNSGSALFAGFQGFPISGDLDDIGDKALRERLERARRRSLAWVPKVGSPLRGVSYGL